MADLDANAIYHGAVPAHLAGYVAGIHGFDIHGRGRLTHRAVPVPILPIIVGIDHDHVLSLAAGEIRVASFVAGLADEAVLVEADRFTGVQMNLTPLGAWKVFGPQVADLTGEVAAVEEALSWSAGPLSDRLGDIPDWPARMRFMTALVSDRIAAGPDASPEVVRAWELLAASDGRTSVGSLADEVGWSSRHLSGRFRQQIGMSPKRTGRLLRFHAAMGLIGGDTPLAEIAVACGYTDQSHFTNEVVHHSGSAPAALRAGLRTEPAVTSAQPVGSG